MDARRLDERRQCSPRSRLANADQRFSGDAARGFSSTHSRTVSGPPPMTRLRRSALWRLREQTVQPYACGGGCCKLKPDSEPEHAVGRGGGRRRRICARLREEKKPHHEAVMPLRSVDLSSPRCPTMGEHRWPGEPFGGTLPTSSSWVPVMLRRASSHGLELRYQPAAKSTPCKYCRVPGKCDCRRWGRWRRVPFAVGRFGDACRGRAGVCGVAAGGGTFKLVKNGMIGMSRVPMRCSNGTAKRVAQRGVL